MDIRSISLPSRLHPTEFEAQLEKLKSTSSLTSNTIISSLVTLAELYNNSIHNLTQRSIDHALEESLELLDCCSSIREVTQMAKESARALQSALRRNAALQNDVASYAESRKRVNKCVKKCLKALKKLEASDHVLRGVTVGVFRSALLFFSSSSSFSVRSRVARVVGNKCEHHDKGVVNEVGCVDLALRDGGFGKERVLMSLQNLDRCVDGIEEGLERVFRELVRCRVNLLNIVTNH
ncbi:hypothetical protein SASPL_103568 [Salvia splendens]|uniref:Uncharacterized protein n=1 Tax=Salvia splendens TaxID=180675 RepID=A0A8X9A903_SALSN|nr:uncharacterized protein LOC121793105 [Salvia splendens]KAG6431996.1 hypothetical protein SASPL_103568 [Salvia splendens]